MELKEFVVLGLLAVFVVGSLGFVNAEKVPTDDVGQGFISRIISQIRYTIHENKLFTIYGEEMECSIYPNKKIKLRKFGHLFPVYPTAFGFDDWKDEPIFTDKGYMVNVYRGYPGHENGMQYIKELYYRADEDTAYVTDGPGKGEIINDPLWECDAGAYWDKYCYVEIYTCPDGACEADNDCESDEECDRENPHISQTFPGLGICKYKGEEPPTHTTEVYQCQKDGTANLIKEVSYDNNLACADPDKNRYKYYDYYNTGSPGAGCWTPENQQCQDYTKEENGGNGNGEESKSVSLTIEEWNRATPKMIVGAMCQFPSDCTEREGYNVSCIYSDEVKQINKNAVDKLQETEGSFVEKLCEGAKFSWSDIGVTGVLKGALWLSPASYVYNWVCTDEEVEVSGTCRAEEPSGIISAIKKLGRSVPITGDAQTDGIIVIVGGLFMLIILMNQGYYIGGKEYEIFK